MPFTCFSSCADAPAIKLVRDQSGLYHCFCKRVGQHRKINRALIFSQTMQNVTYRAEAFWIINFINPAQIYMPGTVSLYGSGGSSKTCDHMKGCLCAQVSVYRWKQHEWIYAEPPAAHSGRFEMAVQHCWDRLPWTAASCAHGFHLPLLPLQRSLPPLKTLPHSTLPLLSDPTNPDVWEKLIPGVENKCDY